MNEKEGVGGKEGGGGRGSGQKHLVEAEEDHEKIRTREVGLDLTPRELACVELHLVEAEV